MNHNTLIARMNADTVSKVASLEELCFSSPWSEESLREILDRPEFLYITLCEGGKLLGYCGVYFAADEANITNIAVHPTARNRGLAKQLLSEIISEATQRSAASVYLEVRISNTVARHVYEQCGFTLAGIRKGFYDKPKEDGCVYVYRI